METEQKKQLTFKEKSQRLHWYIERCSEFRVFREMARETLMNNLAPRIYALSKRFYVGCGFHYGLEEALGNLIRGFAICENPNNINMNSYDYIIDREGMWVLYEVLFEGLCHDVIEAEESVAKLIDLSE